MKPLILTPSPATAAVSAPPVRVLNSFLARAKSIRQQRLTQAQRRDEKQKWIPQFAAEIPLWESHYAAAVTALAAGDPEPLFRVLSQFSPLAWGPLFSDPTVNKILTDWWVDTQFGIKSQGRANFVRLSKILSQVNGGNFPHYTAAELAHKDKEKNPTYQHEYRTRRASAVLRDTPAGVEREAKLKAWENGKNAAQRQAVLNWRQAGKEI